MAFNNGTLLNFFYPMPNEVDDVDDWRLLHWGTSSEIDNCGKKIDVYDAVWKRYFQAEFLTSGPAVGAVARAADELEFKPTYYYYEPRQWNAGVWECGKEQYFDLHFVRYLENIFGISTLWSPDKKEVEGEAEKVAE